MKRRGVLASSGTILLTGCLDRSFIFDDDTDAADDFQTTTELSRFAVGERVRQCERDYIRSEVDAREDERLDDVHTPIIVETESRSEGTYVEVETGYATLRTYGEDEPEEHTDYLVTGYYLVTDDGIYRIEDTDEDPREGTEVDC